MSLRQQFIQNVQFFIFFYTLIKEQSAHLTYYYYCRNDSKTQEKKRYMQIKKLQANLKM